MSLSSNIGLIDYKDECIPHLMELTFFNDTKVIYQRTNEARSSDNGRKENLNYDYPKFDLPEEINNHTFEAMLEHCEQRLLLLNEQQKAAFDKAEIVFKRKKENLEKYCKLQNGILEKAKEVQNKLISENYQELKRKIEARMGELRDHPERLKILIGWLRAAGVSEFSKVGDMLEKYSVHIEKNINAFRSESAKPKWDTFLSHVQKGQGDLCRSLAEVLRKEKITAWLDKDVDRKDDVGMIQGVVNSNIFTIVLTTQYFKRPYCLFEFCVALVAGKRVIALRESDPGKGGGVLSSIGVPEMFRHVKQYEIIEVNREYWEAFVNKYITRLHNTMKSGFTGITKEPGLTNKKKLSIMDLREETWLATELSKENRIIGNRLLE